MDQLLDTADVARRLGVGAGEVRRLLGAKDLLGVRRAGRWFVPEREVRRHELLPRPRGRPFTPTACWQLLRLLDDVAPEVSSQRAWQLRGYLDGDPLDVATRLRRRAERHVIHVHRSLVDQLLRADGVTPSGISALDLVGADLVAEPDHAEAYVTPDRFAPVVRDVAAREDPMGNVTLHVLPPGLEAPTAGRARRAMVALDLLESGDPRTSAAGEQLWLETLERGAR